MRVFPSKFCPKLVEKWNRQLRSIKALFDNPENCLKSTGSDLFCLNAFDNSFKKQLTLNCLSRKQFKTLTRRYFT